MAVDAARAKSLFLAASDLADPAERAAYLGRECGGDAELRARVEALLRADDAAPLPPAGSGDTTVAPDPRPQGPGGPGEASPGPDEAAPHPTPPADHRRDVEPGLALAGRYTLVQRVGEGGMGEVWVARQTEPVRRTVAVKVIKAGMGSRAVLARFDAERQALALMDHPNIAKVLDGGLTPDGRPFFVMELVRGVSITRFCDDRKLTPRQRLELFIPVCQAIQHAHTKGVIHRDIKPSNVLVALYDDRPVPKVIDFGIAKATGQSLTDGSLMTGFGAVVGTPEYMSPEQASLNNLDIDTRSDVYSLGVLLYELLAGSPPFRSDELQRAGLLEMLRVVCEEDPPRPSVKLSTANRLAGISADRGTEPKRLTGLLRNELDWIVMKALERDRSRRYETASGFAADVQRYLAGEAVQAHPPSAAYRLRKFVRKHGVGLATAASFLGLLVVAAVVSIWLAVKANRAEVVADEKRIEAETNAEEAKKNSTEAEKNLSLYADSARKQVKALRDLAIKAKSLQIDIDLTQDARIGVLQLVRTTKEVPENPVLPDFPGMGLGGAQETVMVAISQAPELVALREFATAAVLATGQDYAPLLPPITHDGHRVAACHFDPGLRRVLTLGEDHTARLWDIRTARPVAILQREREQVLSCGFSPDGATVFTDSCDGVVRLWEAADGAFRAATAPRLDRLLPRGTDAPPLDEFPQRTWIADERLLTVSLVRHEPFAATRGRATWDTEDPVELWDTRTGRLVARLDRTDREAPELTFLHGGRWVATTDGKSSVLVFSADDGRHLARLDHPKSETVRLVSASPSGRRIATISNEKPLDPIVRMWDTASWRAEPPSMLFKFQNVPQFSFLTDELFEFHQVMGGEIAESHVYRYGQVDPIARFWDACPIHTGPCLTEGHLAYLGSGHVLDMRNWQQLVPPAGRLYHPDLARFAPDGRFVLNDPFGSGLIDTRTEKSIPMPVVGFGVMPPYGHVSGLGMVLAETKYATHLRLIPTAGREFPPDLLELWAQVAVRGEIGPDGAFRRWDEATWEEKRQRLASVPAPYPDFPFPGHVATDRLHWLRGEFREAADADKLRIARELLRRCEAVGDHAEAVRWRAEVDRRAPAAAPQPGTGKR